MYIDGREFKNALGEKMRHSKIKKNTKVRRLERNHCEENKDYAGFARGCDMSKRAKCTILSGTHAC